MRFLFLLLVVPLAVAHISLYVSGYSSSSYSYTSGESTLQAKDFHFFIGALRDWGYKDVLYSDSVDTTADAIIILGCTDDLSAEDVQKVKKYVEDGGGLVLDLFCRSNEALAREFGIFSGDDYKGVATASWITDYVEIYNGYYVGSPIVSGPITGYEKMFYVGKDLRKVGGDLYPAFATESGQNPAFWGYYGEGRVFITGCLLCGDQTLITNVIDWIEDGKIDFPEFIVGRRTYPKTAEQGVNVRDEITIAFSDPSMEATLKYPYNESGFCKSVPKIRKEGGEKSTTIIMEHSITESGSCFLPPFLVRITWVSPEGQEYVREIYMEKKPIHVQEVTVPVVNPVIYILVIAGTAFVIIAYFVYSRKMMERELRRELEMLKKKEEILHRDYMLRKIDEETYRKILQEYTKQKEELLAKLSIFEKQDKSKGKDHD